MSDSVLANQYAIQHEMIPFLLTDILNMLKSGKIEELIAFMDDLIISNEMVKEHLMGLSMDKNLQKQFD
jgi:hypothetical protein